MRRILTVLVALLIGCLPISGAVAASKQMRDGVPVWDEETVKQYALDFVQGSDFERLFSYYDLQVRRYMPMDTFTAMLTEIEWMTGGFVGFGTYASFDEDALKTRTHGACGGCGHLHWFGVGRGTGRSGKRTAQENS